MARFATLVLLSFQLMVLVAGATPVPDACCCVSKGKVCKCKSHAKKSAPAPDGRPCFSAQCAPGTDVPFFVMEWVTVPDPVDHRLDLATALLAAWPHATAGPLRAQRPEAPPPRTS